jgi:hypothetical protein
MSASPSFSRKLARKILPRRIYGALRVLGDPNLFADVDFAAYNQDRLLTQNNCDFVRDKRFAAAYAVGEATDSWWNVPIHWRIHVMFWAATRALEIEGDFVECGVNRGGFSRSIMEFIDFKNVRDKKYYLLDTFNGLVDKLITDEERENGIRPGHYAECFAEVQETFKDFANVELILGMVPDTLPQVRSEKVCYLSLDMNCAQPEIEAAEFFWDKLSSGAAVILDDYGFTEFAVQKREFDRFATRKNVSILTLPTGQGLILKP